jgi:hypothetical protein
MPQVRSPSPRQALCWGVLFFACLQLAIGLALELGPAVRDPEYAVKQAQLLSLSNATPDRPLVVMLGSSRTMLALQAGRLGRAAGGRPALVYNFGLVGCGPILGDVTLHRLLAAGLRPDLLFVEVLTPDLNQAGDHYQEEDWLHARRLGLAELLAVRRHGSHPDNLLRQWCQSRLLPCGRPPAGLRRWLGLDARAAGTSVAGPPTDAYGWHAHALPGLTPAEYRRHADLARWQYRECFGDFRLAAGPARALRDLLDCCRREHIPAALVLMPEGSEFRALYPEAVRRGIDRFLADLARETEVPVIDARTWVEDAGFWDGHHLLPEGATAFTDRFDREALRPLLGRWPPAGRSRKVAPSASPRVAPGGNGHASHVAAGVSGGPRLRQRAGPTRPARRRRAAGPPGHPQGGE